MLLAAGAGEHVSSRLGSLPRDPRMAGNRDLAAGSILGRYQLVLRVASGGMGEVWAARVVGAKGLKKFVAIKTLRAELSHDPNFEQMFLDEARLASRIKHP